MLADIQGNKLLLTTDKQLKPSQESQLNFWGFKKTKYGFEHVINDNGELLGKVQGFFIKEKESFLLSGRARILAKRLAQKKEELELIKKEGNQYKDGTYPIKQLNILKGEFGKITYRKLKNHQLKAAIHLYIVKNGANFSVPGSGKTSVVLSVYEKLRKEGKVNTLFVVGPVACFQPWKDEFKATLNRDPTNKILAGGNVNLRKTSYFIANKEIPELYLTTFQTLLKDHKDVYTFMNRAGVNIFFVVDEAHYIKKINGNWSSAVLDLARYSKFRCALTGTPIPHSFSDLFNLFGFLYPEESPLSDKDKIKIMYLEGLSQYDEVKNLLKNKIGPLFYRVRKSDLGLRPATFHPPIVLPMNKLEKKLYDLITNRIIEYGKEDYLKNANILKNLRKGRVMRLRQSVSYVKLLKTVIEGYSEDLIDGDTSLEEIIRHYDDLEKPAKLEFLIKFLKEKFKNKKVVVWSNFIDTIKLIHEELSINGLVSKYIYGDTPVESETIKDEETREKIIREFLNVNSGLNVLIANPAACAESISLHKTCHTAVYYDISYNCAQYLQSLDRIHRVGGSESSDTNYYFLQYENSIDQDIEHNLFEKARRMNSLIEEDYSIYDLDMVADMDYEEEGAYFRLISK